MHDADIDFIHRDDMLNFHFIVFVLFKDKIRQLLPILGRLKISGAILSKVRILEE